MKKRITTEERNKRIFLAIKELKEQGEIPNCKNVSEKTGFSRTYLFKILEKERKKPSGERIKKILELRTHKKMEERVEEILRTDAKFLTNEGKINYKKIASENGISENYVYKIYNKLKKEREKTNDKTID